jgi:hypothetical protein
MGNFLSFSPRVGQAIFHLIHANLIVHLYSNFTHYREFWEKRWEETQEFGAFVFLPGKELDWEWWDLNRIRQYIQDGGLNEEEMLKPNPRLL